MFGTTVKLSGASDHFSTKLLVDEWEIEHDYLGQASGASRLVEDHWFLGRGYCLHQPRPPAPPTPARGCRAMWSPAGLHEAEHGVAEGVDPKRGKRSYGYRCEPTHQCRRHRKSTMTALLRANPPRGDRLGALRRASTLQHDAVQP